MFVVHHSQANIASSSVAGGVLYPLHPQHGHSSITAHLRVQALAHGLYDALGGFTHITAALFM